MPDGIAPSNDAVMAGQAAYSKTTLAVYDFIVLRVFVPFVWRCPTTALLDLYQRNLSSNHMDCGVGTGFFLDRCLTTGKARIVLVDLNPNSLSKAARRLRRYGPRAYARNVLAPLAIEEAKFDSIGMNLLLHCLPGAIHEKATAFDQVSAYLKPGGRVFGSTILRDALELGFAARTLMASFNRKRIFSNTNDTLEGLRQELGKRFEDVSIEVEGAMALFRARKLSNGA
jgi:SAM-dependent methyltransferase